MPHADRVLRYVQTWLTGRSRARQRPLVVEREDRAVPALLVAPERGPCPLPAWIALHGVTRPGIHHPQLLRFAHALASTGTAVLVPEVPEWKDLRLAPEATLPTVIGALRTLLALPEVRPPFGLVGFSFGAPQVLIAASHESVAPHVRGVACFGGYCDLRRLVHFYFTGDHEWQGRPLHGRPDPYGRWMMGANYLTIAPGYGDAQDVAQALWNLAAAAGELRAPADDPRLDGLRRRLRAGLSASRRELFDLFDQPADRPVDMAAVAALEAALTAGSQAVSPLMEPAPFLARLARRVELLHGRGDRLMPYSESLRLKEQLPAETRASVTVTRLFAHTRGDRFPLLKGPSEVWSFLGALGRVLGTV
jgi:pimeloyl-ACP methyl ester carboxylesterase